MLRQLLAEARGNGEGLLEAFMSAELCVVLACTRAAQGYPDWESALHNPAALQNTALEEAAAEDDSDEDEDESEEEEENVQDDLMALWS